jgi:hypothetical protein
LPLQPKLSERSAADFRISKFFFSPSIPATKSADANDTSANPRSNKIAVETPAAPTPDKIRDKRIAKMVSQVESRRETRE